MPDARILVIEDNPANRELVCDLLTVAGFEVIQAEDAAKGIELAASEAPDLVLTDIGLPGADGLELTRGLRAVHGTKHTPILAVTSHAMKGDRERVLAAGCDGYITKPIDTRTFADNVRQYLPG